MRFITNRPHVLAFPVDPDSLSPPISCSPETPPPFEVTAHAVWAAGLPHLRHLSLLRESFPLQSNRFPAWNRRDFQQATPQGFGVSFPLLLPCPALASLWGSSLDLGMWRGRWLRSGFSDGGSNWGREHTGQDAPPRAPSSLPATCQAGLTLSGRQNEMSRGRYLSRLGLGAQSGSVGLVCWGGLSAEDRAVVMGPTLACATQCSLNAMFSF